MYAKTTASSVRLTEICKDSDKSNKYGVHVACFSEAGDKQVDLWQRYGQGGKGLCISLDLTQADATYERLKHLQPRNSYAFQFARCEYELGKQTEIVDQWLRESVDLFHATRRRGREDSAHVLAALACLSDVLFKIAPRLKALPWAAQREWRLILKIPWDDPSIKYNEKGKRYVEFRLADDDHPLIFPKIYIGSETQGELSSENAVLDFLSRNGVKCDLICRLRSP